MIKTTTEIRAYHCDGFGHVNNARWLELFDEARWAMWTQRAWFAERQLVIVTRRIEVDYLRPAVIDDTIEIESTWQSFEVDAAWLKQTARRGNKVCAEALVKLQITGPDSPRAVKLTDELLERMQ